jgi:FMN phosphatase YigB (HAD superfamily)
MRELLKGKVVVTDMDEVLVSIVVPIYQHMLDNKNYYSNNYDLRDKLTYKDLDNRNHPFVNKWLNIEYDREKHNNIMDFISNELDYMIIPPTQFCLLLLDMLRSKELDKLYVLTSIISETDIIKKQWLKLVFEEQYEKIVFLKVQWSTDNPISKSEVWNQLGIDLDIFIDDDLTNIMDIANFSNTKGITILTPQYGYNHMAGLSKYENNRPLEIKWYNLNSLKVLVSLVFNLTRDSNHKSLESYTTIIKAPEEDYSELRNRFL